jgi:hypothetical protein
MGIREGGYFEGAVQKNGGDDETRTRDLCRDRREVTRWPTQNQAVRCAAVGNRWLHWQRRLVFVQRFVHPSSPCRARAKT